MASTPEEIAKLSPKEIAEQLVWARTRLSFVANSSLRKSIDRQIRMLENAQGAETRVADPPSFPLIPTSYRAKIWKSTGYPIGAESVSQALRDVPQYHKIELRFWEYDTLSVRGGRPIGVIHGEYFCSRGGIFRPSVPRIKYRVCIHAVPRTLKNVIKDALTDNGLERLRNWLIAINQLEGCEGRASIDLKFTDDNELVDMEERDILPRRP